jgi:hypothetical protein
MSSVLPQPATFLIHLDKAHEVAREGADATFNNNLFSQLQQLKAANHHRDASSFIPAITDAELEAQILAVVKPGGMSDEEYQKCIAIAADNAVWLYDSMHRNMTRWLIPASKKGRRS